MTVQRILAVDDEAPIRAIVDYALSQEGFEVSTEADASGATAALAQSIPDLVILDVMLPDGSGLEIARELRARSNVPIIILSARAEEVDRILGLEFGADDYVTKPFSPRELVSRVKALLRRAGALADDATHVSVGDLQIDVKARVVRRGETPIHLTSTEYSILLCLARRQDTVLSRDEILSAVREETPVGDERAIDVHVHNIREKLEPDPKHPAYLHTVRGFGYRLGEA